MDDRPSEREPADSLRDKSTVIGGWLPSLTFTFRLQTMRISHTGGCLITAVLVCVQGFGVGDIAVRADQEQGLEGLTITELSKIASDATKDKNARWQATSELARRKDPSTTSLLVRLLKDDYSSIRGSAAWGLSQIGGQDAQDALLEFLRKSLEPHNWIDLDGATEAQKVLPDTRALDLLIKCLNTEKPTEKMSGYSAHRRYAAEALGKIGNPKASLAIAQRLDVNIEYYRSLDFIYLDAIRKTKGREAVPILIDYLDRLVAKMPSQNLPQFHMPIGRAGREAQYNYLVFGLVISALESTSGRKSVGDSREKVSQGWKEWWKKSSEQIGAPNREPAAGSR